MKSINTNTQKNNKTLLLTLIFLTALSVALQFITIFKQFGSLLSTDKGPVGEFALNLIHQHQLDFMPLIKFCAAQLLLYCAVVAVIYYMACKISRVFKLSNDHTFLLGISLWFINVIFIATANSYLFPHSAFALTIVNHTLLGIASTLTAIFLIIAILLTISTILKDLIQKRQWFRGLISIIICALLIGFGFHYTHPTPNSFSSTAKQPNIIVIGLDSIRPDHTGYYGNKNINTPTIDNFLGSSANFTQAYSAQARTYVAWNSILSGKYPKHDHVRDNLIDPDSLDLSNTLVTALKQAGYGAIFATDNRQFSLINKYFGFDKIISPRMGIYDFIFSMFNDFPLSNLVMNSPVGEWLFPYNYANRMSYVTYQPQTFTKMLNRKLANRPNKPLFLGIHVILTHFPYEWTEDNQPYGLSTAKKYSDMVQDIDKQFALILNTLKQNNLLQHAVVVLISDHGVSLGLPGDRSINPAKYIGPKTATKVLTRYQYSKLIRQPGTPYLGLNTSDGEGVDVLSFNTSNHIIFGIKTYGEPYGIVKNNSARVSLIDIAPTMLDLLDLPPLYRTDGISLKPYVTTSKTTADKLRALFFETGIWMPLISIDELKQGTGTQYLNQRLNTLYGYDKKQQLIILKPASIKKLLKSKQRGILYGDWFLARYPKGDNITSTIVPKQYPLTHHCDLAKPTDDNEKGKLACYTFTTVAKPYYVLVNTKTGAWTMDLDSNFAKQSPAKLMLAKLKTLYGSEIPE
ncbi:MAG: sulfatase-like hydrolase/transferase [Gammaproteobacteria bacterium]|nr:sulfatase-like hydrolase/transferase [Gammaproteobacteria bacterium]